MRRTLLLVPMLSATLALPMRAQEYQVAAAMTRAASEFIWKDGSGVTSPLQPDGQSSFTPNIFGDVQAPLKLPRGFMVSGDVSLRYVLGDDVSELGWGFGVSRRIKDGYAGLHYLKQAPTNGTSTLGGDWDRATDGLHAIVRRSALRVDVKRTTSRIVTRFAGGDDTRDWTRYGLAVRYGRIGAEVMRWTEELRNGASGATSEQNLTRLSVYFAIGQWGNR